MSEQVLARITKITALNPPRGEILVEFEFLDAEGGKRLVLVERVQRHNPSLSNISDIARNQAADRLERIAAYLRDVENWRDQSSVLPST